MRLLNKEEWLNDIPELIYKLKKNYGFYFSGFSVRISKDILEIITNKKHKHKIVLYQRGQRFFIVVYRKNDTVIYYTNEYVKDQKNSRISYFKKKFIGAYKKAERAVEDEMFNNRLRDN